MVKEINCKQCGCITFIGNAYGSVKYEILNDSADENIKFIYDKYPIVCYCSNCRNPIDYIDLSLDMFLYWIKYISDLGCDRKFIGKALIRYFGLDELFLQKVGDTYR